MADMAAPRPAQSSTPVPYSVIPRGARTKLLFASGDIKAEVQEELRASLLSTVSPRPPDIDEVEEEIRTLPHVVSTPWDLKRGEKFDMMSERVRARHNRRRRRSRFNGQAPDCSTMSRIREIPMRGIYAPRSGPSRSPTARRT